MTAPAPPVAWLALAYVAGLTAGATAIRPPLPLLLLPIVLAPILAWRRPTWGVAIPIAILAGLVAAQAAGRTSARACGHSLVDGPSAFRGAFVSAPSAQRRSARFQVAEGPGGCRGSVFAIVPAGQPGVLPGAPVAITGQWRGPLGGPGRAGALRVEKVIGLEAAPTMVGRLHAFRHRVEDRLAHLFPARGALVHALVLARKDGLDPDLREAFAITGLAHLLAISGFHVGVVAAILISLARAAGLGPRGSPLVTAIGVWVYVLSIGLPDAAVRAAVLLSLAAVARLRARPVHSLGGLAAGLLVMTVVDPSAPTRVGMQLSFAGAAGLVLLSRPIEGALARGPIRGLPAGLGRAIAAGAAATLFTLPLVAWHFERVSIVGIPATLATGPLVAAAIPGIFASLVLSTVSLPAAEFLAGGVEWVLNVVVWLVAVVARIPWASVHAPRPVVLAAAAGAVLTLHWFQTRGRVSGPARRRVAVGGAVAGIIVWPIVAGLGGTDTLEAVFLDVGQGDAIALRSPRGRWVLIDTGPRTARSDAGARVVAPFFRRRGVRRLEALILTHPDLDHIGGVPSVLSAVGARAVFDPGVAAGKGTYVEALEGAGALHVPWLPLARGRVLHFDGVDLEVLHPPPRAESAQDLDANNRSVVLRVRYGAFAMLLAGDLEREGEERLLASGSLKRVQVLKVAHHGSRTSSTSAFLAATAPEVAVIPVGGANRYGHPDPTVLRRLREGGAIIYRTDWHGSVRLRAKQDGSFWIRTERSEGTGSSAQEPGTPGFH